MKGKTTLFSHASPDWSTPVKLYAELDAEFHFNLDPCPLYGLEQGLDGLALPWKGGRVYCNPPYGPGIGDWLAKSVEAELAVYLLPARTDTRWFHEWAFRASEVRFFRGRLRFSEAAAGAPFPSILLVYDNTLGIADNIAGVSSLQTMLCRSVRCPK